MFLFKKPRQKKFVNLNNGKKICQNIINFWNIFIRF